MEDGDGWWRRVSFLELVKEYRTLLRLSGGDAASRGQRALAEKVVEDAQRRAGDGPGSSGNEDLVVAVLEAG